MSTLSEAYGFISMSENGISNKRRRLPSIEDKYEVIMSMYRSRSDTPDMGLAILNTKSVELILLNFCDSSTFSRTIHQLKVHDPSIILLPDAHMNPQIDKLKYVVSSNIPDNIKEVQLKLRQFNTANGFTNIKLHCEYDEVVLQEKCNGNELALAAANACFEYCISSKLIRTNNKLRLKFDNCQSNMLIDTFSIRDLELIDSISDKGTSLFSFLNHSVTKMGKRILRASILQPLTDVPSIKLRLETVQELISNEDILISIRTQLKKFHDMEKIVGAFLEMDEDAIVFNRDQRLNNLILFKGCLENCIEIVKSLDYAKSNLLVEIKAIVSHEYIQTVLNTIKEYIYDTCQWAKNSLELTNQKANAIKSGVNGFLDVSRRVHETLLEETNQIVSKLCDEYGLEIDFRYESSRGFYLRIKEGKMPMQSLPTIFINRIKKRKMTECTTIELMKQSSRFTGILAEIANLNNHIIGKLYEQVASYVPIFFMISEAIGTLDFLCCLAQFVSLQKRDYTCPEFGKEVNVRHSRHPVLETTISNFVPNDYSCIHEISRFQIITGANMSGKSVYLRQIAYIVIMAQIGCFVPAEYAVLPIFESLYTRISSDNTEMNASSFSKEMTEIAMILKAVNDKSLVIIDELGRGSNFTDGFSICLAILEYFITSGAIVFTSTHFREVADILSNKSCVVSSHMEIGESEGQLQMKYQLVKGKVETIGYGIRFAEFSRMLPDNLIVEAKKIANQLRSTRNTNDDERIKSLSKRRKLVLELYYALNHIKSLDAEMEYKLQILKTLQSKFVDEINRLPK
ncbi:MSH4 [[Candida] subhashii]|uniref:DNA mismatch repair protein MSH3 n=1 Tax=[Candida] subhashii TaxID=561895 RepID=A0A8J5UJW1_9ASCO|nr:MSH4 [[Candida] subhashii]KAG7664878.1 MSH4 [[Candida] subhashii]